MAYRGGVLKNPMPNKKPVPFPSNQSGFESQFSDLAFSACPPSSKRPRTNTGGRQNFNNAAKNKTPLKFDFRSTKTNDNTIIPPPAPAAPTSHQRYVSKPVLASQMGGQQQQQAPITGFSQDDWGEDGDDALLLAASQMVEPVAPKEETNEEELLAMTAMLEDDDFGLDDVAGLEAAALEMEQEERLNQTVTVFNCPPTQSTSSQVFRQPPPPQPPQRVHAEMAKVKEEQDRLKKLHMKAQGEASFLRTELGKQSKEIEGERISKRKLEAELKSKMEAERKVKENEISSIKTEKLFLVQEMQQLKEKLKQMEAEVKKDESGVGTPRSRKVLGQIKVEKNDFPTVKEFGEKKFKTNHNDAETQTKVSKIRKCRLRRSSGHSIVMTQSFCRVSSASSQVKAKILQQTNKAGVMREVGRTVTQLTAEINTSLPKPPSPEQLVNIHTLLSSCGSLVTTEDRTAVTETCSNLLSWMIKSSSCSLLSPTLSLLTVAWSITLLDQDITAYILSLLSEIIKLIKSLSDELTPSLMKSIFSLVFLVSRDPIQATLLCKESQDCFLSCIYVVLHMSLTKEQEVQVASCKGLVKWLLHCSAVSHPVPWMNNSCKWCTGDIVRTLTLTTQRQVRWTVDNLNSKEDDKVVVLLRDCVTTLGRLQDNLRSETGEEVEWIKMVEVAASVQRKYIWTVEQLLKMELGQVATDKLNNLAMETDMGPEGERGDNMDID